MQEDDIPEILKIERTSFTSPWSEGAFLHEIYNPYALTKVALLDNRIIGYVCVQYILDEGHILNLAIHPDHRRRGYGTALMVEVLKILKEKGCRFIYLEVRKSNTSAKLFYERFGFRIAGVRKNYYRSPKEDASLMMLRM